MIANKNLSKGISLFIKTSVFVFSVYYVINEIGDARVIVSIEDIFQKTKINYFILAVCLMPINWGLEAIKWKYLIRKTESISFLMSLKSVLSGVCISIFTPNRVGEFAGKVFYLKTSEKAKATIASFIGSSLQLLVTIFAGSLAILFYYKRHKTTLLFKEIINFNHLYLSISIVLFIIVLALVVYQKTLFIPLELKEKIMQFERKELYSVFFLSAIRYLIFSCQYYLVLLMFNIDIGFLNSFILIALTFLVSAVIPTFALTEIVVRSASSIYFFSMATSNSNAIASSSITLWVINLAIPALIGAMFIWQINFFNE
jgi:hypothetical protein